MVKRNQFDEEIEEKRNKILRNGHKRADTMRSSKDKECKMLSTFDSKTLLPCVCMC